MRTDNVFKEWAPAWLIKAVLIYCMLPSMMLLGLYNSNVTYAASYLDIEPEDMQFVMCVTYGTLLATALIEARFFKYFSTRNYFLCIQIFTSAILIISAYTSNYYQFIFLRIAEGICMALPGVSMRMLLLSKFKSKNAIIIVYSIFYGILLTSSTITMHMMVWILDKYDWKHMAYGAALFQVVGMALILLVFNGKRFIKKFPLYQLDWVSYILLLTGVLCGAYVFVYGEKLYWFTSMHIIVAAVIAICFLGLFMLRQLHMKRPSFNMNVLKNADLRIGLLLFLLFYISRATLNMLHSAMGKIWNWEPIHVVHVQYINAAGIVAGLTISAILFARGTATRYLLAIGFFCLAVYHIWFTFLFVPDVSLQQISVPYFLQGAGVGMIFVPLVLFSISTLKREDTLAGGFVSVSGRFWGTTIGFCLIQNAQVFLQQNHYSKLQQFVSVENAETQNRLVQSAQSFLAKGYSTDAANNLAIRQISSSLVKQTVLLSNMEIYTVVGCCLLVLIVLILLNQHIKHSIGLIKRRSGKYFPKTMW